MYRSVRVTDQLMYFLSAYTGRKFSGHKAKVLNLCGRAQMTSHFWHLSRRTLSPNHWAVSLFVFLSRRLTSSCMAYDGEKYHYKKFGQTFQISAITHFVLQFGYCTIKQSMFSMCAWLSQLPAINRLVAGHFFSRFLGFFVGFGELFTTWLNSDC